MEIQFTSSNQVEDSFYQAFRTRDIHLMKKVWEQSDEAICIHPDSPRIYSFDLIIASWQQIFSAPKPISIEIKESSYFLENELAIHCVKEVLSVDSKPVGSTFATNIYRQTGKGWKMITHHASRGFDNNGKKSSVSLH